VKLIIGLGAENDAERHVRERRENHEKREKQKEKQKEDAVVEEKLV
jgi:hypothetical protein